MVANLLYCLCTVGWIFSLLLVELAEQRMGVVVGLSDWQYRLGWPVDVPHLQRRNQVTLTQLMLTSDPDRQLVITSEPDRQLVITQLALTGHPRTQLMITQLRLALLTLTGTDHPHS